MHAGKVAFLGPRKGFRDAWYRRIREFRDARGAMVPHGGDSEAVDGPWGSLGVREAILNIG